MGTARAGTNSKTSRRLSVPIVALAVAVGVLAAAPCSADVEPRDRNILVSAINSVLENSRTDTVNQWSNPATGSIGTVTVTRTFFRGDGTPCRAFRWTLEPGSGTVASGGGTGCRTAARQWIRDLPGSRLDTGSAGPDAAVSPPTATEVRSAQRMLAALGYEPGPADGRIGPQTRAAVTRFQRDQGLPADGQVSAGLLSSLSTAMAAQRGTEVASAARTGGVATGSSRASPRLGVLPASAPKTRPLQPSDIFREVGDSVWVLLAARSSRELRRGRGDVSLGSAVAVSDSHLLTNCHIIEGRPTVYALQGDEQVPATLVAADRRSDRCVLAVEALSLSPVPGVRRFNDIAVGERVFTIGTPKGLERTLGEGLVSGLRSREGTRYVQTTAPISEGSSGGGLFDEYGNLIGITTAYIGGGQQLNFAIAAEEYWR